MLIISDKKDTPDNLYCREYHNTKTKLDLTKLFYRTFHNVLPYYECDKYRS